MNLGKSAKLLTRTIRLICKMGYYKKCLSTFVVLQLTCICTFSSQITISGVVKDAETKETLPFVNVWVVGTMIGTTTNLNGNYSLHVNLPCKIRFSSIGFQPEIKEFEKINKDVKVDVLLKKDIHAIGEVQIKPDLSYDRHLFKKILENKKQNNPDECTINFDKFNRVSILHTSNKKGRLATIISESINAVSDGDDSTQNYTPVYQTEELSRHIWNKEKHKETRILSSKTDGIFPNLNSQIDALVLQKIAFDFNFYKNTISILDRGFPSPISNNAFLYYNIYLEDSTLVDGVKRYEFSFFPKNEHSIVFKGHFWVEDSSFALTEIKAKLSQKANINFIKSLSIEINFEKTPDGNWFYKRQSSKIKMSLRNIKSDSSDSLQIKDNKGFLFINKRSIYEVLAPRVDSVEGEISDTILSNIQYLNQMYFSEESLEEEVYNGIQKIKKDPYIKAIDKTGSMFLTSYLNLNKIDFGPIFDLYTRNAIEGNRFTLPLRTSQNLFKNFTIGGYVGYGTKSKQWKYGFETKYLLPSQRRTIISLKYSNDYNSLGVDDYLQFIKENAFSKGNGSMVASLTSKTANPFMILQKRMYVGVETQMGRDIGLLVQPFYQISYTNSLVPFFQDGKKYSKFSNLGVLLNFRFSFGQNYEELYFSRIYYGNQKPVINLSIKAGQCYFQDGLEQKNSTYAHFHASIKSRFNLGQAYLRVMANSGYIAGNVPYTMLNKPTGTQSFGYARYSYNLLNHASFAHNIYTNLHLSLNGGGILFNKIPLISNLNLREIISLKCYYGKLISGTNSIFEMPAAFSNSLKTPYTEFGFGVSNIFKCIRIEYINRIGNEKNADQYSTKHGLRMRFEVAF